MFSIYVRCFYMDPFPPLRVSSLLETPLRTATWWTKPAINSTHEGYHPGRLGKGELGFPDVSRCFPVSPWIDWKKTRELPAVRWRSRDTIPQRPANYCWIAQLKNTPYDSYHLRLQFLTVFKYYVLWFSLVMLSVWHTHMLKP